MNRRDVLAAGLASLSAAALAPLTALAYPDRVIRLVVPFSAGGATDVVGRLWAEKMKPILGTVVTENRGGGGGVIGAAEVARSQPDGHTFLFGNTSTQVLVNASAAEAGAQIYQIQVWDKGTGQKLAESAPGTSTFKQVLSLSPGTHQLVVRRYFHWKFPVAAQSNSNPDRFC